MILDTMAKRITELTRECEESAARHNGLVGALLELKNLYHEAVQAGPNEDDMVKVIEDAAKAAEDVV